MKYHKTITLKDGSEKLLYTSDVNEIEDILIENGIDPVVRDVPGENLLVSSIIPILVGLFVITFLFVMMNNAQGQSSSNNRMMNFGKSRRQRLVVALRSLSAAKTTSE